MSGLTQLSSRLSELMTLLQIDASKAKKIVLKIIKYIIVFFIMLAGGSTYLLKSAIGKLKDD